MSRLVAVATPLVLAGFELAHPVAPSGSLADAALASPTRWIALHVALIVGYALLAGILWRCVGRLGRAFVLAFAASNTAFLLIDGVAIGALALADPSTANEVSSNTAVAALANATGGLWAVTLLSVAVARSSGGPPTLDVGSPKVDQRLVVGGVVATWAALAASSVVPLAGLASRAIAVLTGAVAVYAGGASQLPFALLVFAAVLRQHVGPEAALGMLCIAAALELEGRRTRGRSVPAASSRP